MEPIKAEVVYFRGAPPLILIPQGCYAESFENILWGRLWRIVQPTPSPTSASSTAENTSPNVTNPAKDHPQSLLPSPSAGSSNSKARTRRSI
jgi:hypothetical protein